MLSLEFLTQINLKSINYHFDHSIKSERAKEVRFDRTEKIFFL